MKQGVFQQSVQIVQDYVVQQSFNINQSIKPPKKNNNIQIRIRMQPSEEIKPYMPIGFKQKPHQDSFEVESDQFQTLNQYCKKKNHQLIYQRFLNDNYNSLRGNTYYSSLFLSLDKFKPEYKIDTFQDLLRQLKIPISKDIPQLAVRFDSRFQSGNLLAAFKIGQNQYDLVLQNDLNSKGNIQWFYFSVEVDYPMELRFNIINMMKYDSLFNYGMQPVFYSIKKNKKNGEQWFHSGKHITYQRNDLRLQNRAQNYYTLSFSYDFKSQDKVYIAYHFPYTHSRFQELFYSISSNQTKSKFCKRNIIGKSLLNVPIQCLTFGYDLQIQKDSRKIVIILCRQHPGQTVGSWIAQGFIQHMLKKSKDVQWLKKNVIVKIIPMLNPDGVILGNYRCNFSGLDLNRKWDSQKKNLVPQILSIKGFIKQLAKQRRIAMIIDLHGHSKKNQSFFYGNYNLRSQIPRSFPYMASKLSNDVNFNECIFTRTEDRKNTARMYLSNILELPYVYTYQCSFYGGLQKGKKYAYKIQDYKRLGMELAIALYHFNHHETEVYNLAFAELCEKLKSMGNLDKQSCSQSQPQKNELKDSDRDQLRQIQLKILEKENQQKLKYRPKVSYSRQNCKLQQLKILKSNSQQQLFLKNILQTQYISNIVNRQKMHTRKKKSNVITEDKSCQTELLFQQQFRIFSKPRLIKANSNRAKILFSIQRKSLGNQSIRKNIYSTTNINNGDYSDRLIRKNRNEKATQTEKVVQNLSKIRLRQNSQLKIS